MRRSGLVGRRRGDGNLRELREEGILRAGGRRREDPLGGRLAERGAEVKVSTVISGGGRGGGEALTEATETEEQEARRR